MQDSKQLVNETIESAEMVLIGMGSEFAGFDSKMQKAYSNLAKLVNGKNYYVITTNMDGEIRECGLDQMKIVEPCGTYYKLQCSAACHNLIYPVSESMKKEIRTKLVTKNENIQLEMPNCPKCGEKLCFNLYNQENYVEEGYLLDWEMYTKWLQGTLNRKLCILELGVGMNTPSIIRWPFEKIAFYNQKATFFRVHSQLYQMQEGIAERGISIRENPISFFTSLEIM